MTNDYNNGDWWGWNGGECPVHLKSIVETVWRSKEGNIRARKDIGAAENAGFPGNAYGDLIAFRVIKEHREPREFWLRLIGGEIRGTDAGALPPPNWGGTGQVVIRVREVIE